MNLILAFTVFLAAMAVTLVLHGTLILPLLAGLASFMTVGLRNGYCMRELIRMAADGTKDALIVIKVMCFIGFLTAVWRISGTITIFVYYGMRIITPSLFLIITFLLSCILSYALGTSFGVAGTVGVIFMTLARSGGVDPAITAGIIMSGIYFGDRGSPVSSSANMVAGVTGTNLFENVKRMMRSGAAPLAVTAAVYSVLSVMNPLEEMDLELISAFESEFALSLWSFIPAIVMLILPLLKVKVLSAMGISIFSGMIVAWQKEGMNPTEIIKICIFGYHPDQSKLVMLLDGGGLSSMLQIICILLISCAYAGIFNGTGMLEDLQAKFTFSCKKYGRYPTAVFLSICLACIFCNQTISVLMCVNLLKKSYLDSGGTKEELALDMENSVILISCFIPWTIGWSIPTSFFGVGAEALPFACYMYLVPFMWLIQKQYAYS